MNCFQWSASKIENVLPNIHLVLPKHLMNTHTRKSKCIWHEWNTFLIYIFSLFFLLSLFQSSNQAHGFFHLFSYVFLSIQTITIVYSISLIFLYILPISFFLTFLSIYFTQLTRYESEHHVNETFWSILNGNYQFDKKLY